MRRIFLITLTMLNFIIVTSYCEIAFEKIRSNKRVDNKCLPKKRPPSRGTGAKEEAPAITTHNAGRNRGPSQRIIPYIEFETRFDDNIFREQDKEHDFILTVTPGVKYDKMYKSEKKIAAAFDLGAHFIKYIENPKFDTINLFAEFGLGNKTLNANYRIEKDQRAISEIEENAEKDFATSWSNSAWVNFNRDFGKNNIDASYKHTNITYEEDDRKSDNVDKDQVFVEGRHYFSPKSNRAKYISLRYDRSMIRYPKKHDSDYDIDKVWAGFGEKISKKINGHITSGFGWSHSKENGYTSPYFLYGAELLYNANSNFNCNIGMSRDVSESSITTRDRVESTSYSAGCSYKPPFNPKISLKGDASYGKRDYSGNRKDDIYKIGCGLNYSLREDILLSSGYTYSKVKSNMPNQSYDNNVVTLKLRMEF